MKKRRNGLMAFCIAEILGSLVLSNLYAAEIPTPALVSSKTNYFQMRDVEASVKIQSNHYRDQTLIASNGDTSSSLESRFDIQFKQELTHGVELRSRIYLFSASTAGNGLNSDDDQLGYRIKRFHLQLGDQDNSQRLRVGRQPITDDMAWIVDEDLDGFRLNRRRDNHQIDLSMTRQDWFSGSNEKQVAAAYNYYGGVSIEGRNHSTWLPYVFNRQESANGFSEPNSAYWVGLQVRGNLNKKRSFWLNTAARYGEQDRTEEIRSLGGYALDAGTTYEFDAMFKPSLTLGYARASGDSNPDSAIDNGFRQTGLHSNKSRFNGLTNFHYLGEALDPELANIEILTIGAGIRLKKRWSIDAIYHQYKQVVLSDRLRGSDVDYDPTGLNSSLGQELDVVIGFKPTKRLELNAIGGIFSPGAAFDSTVTQSNILKLELEYAFR